MRALCWWTLGNEWSTHIGVVHVALSETRRKGANRNDRRPHRQKWGVHSRMPFAVPIFKPFGFVACVPLERFFSCKHMRLWSARSWPSAAFPAKPPRSTIQS